MVKWTKGTYLNIYVLAPNRQKIYNGTFKTNNNYSMQLFLKCIYFYFI
jgi:hypothetical protein